MTARVVATLPDSDPAWVTADCWLTTVEDRAARLPRPEAEALARQVRRIAPSARVEVVADTDPEEEQ